MRIVINTEIDIPAAAVFEYIADLTNNPEWQSGVAETVWTTPLPLTVGTECRQTLDSGEIVNYRVVAIDEGRAIAIETLPGASVAGSISRTVNELNVGRCRVRMELEGRVRGWRFILTPLIRRLIRSSIAADYRRLKRLLETDEEPADE